MQPRMLPSWLQLLSFKMLIIAADVYSAAIALASAYVGDAPLGYLAFHIDLASVAQTKPRMRVHT